MDELALKQISQRLLDRLMTLMVDPATGNSLDRAMTDAAVLGSGYLRFTPTGIEYVPNADIKLAPSASGESNG